MDTQLDEFRLVCPGRDMWTSTALVLDRRHRAVLDLDQIEPRDQAEPVG